MIETRMIAYKSLDDAWIKTLSDTIEYLKKEDKAIYSLTLDTYNYYLKKGKNNVQ
jgi:HD superfamily phosphohydrolase YqeK